MVRVVPTTTGRTLYEPEARTRRERGKRASPWLWLFACVAAAAPLSNACAAMNLCAAPALQTSERTNAAPGVEALLKSVAARLSAMPKPLVRLHTEGTLPH